MLNGMRFDFQLFASVFDKFDGYWKKGGDENVSWIDFVIYKGGKKEIDLTKIDEAMLGFTFSAGSEAERVVTDKPSVSLKDKNMEINWNDMSLNIPVKPGLQPKHL